MSTNHYYPDPMWNYTLISVVHAYSCMKIQRKTSHHYYTLSFTQLIGISVIKHPSLYALLLQNISEVFNYIQYNSTINSNGYVYSTIFLNNTGAFIIYQHERLYNIRTCHLWGVSARIIEHTIIDHVPFFCMASTAYRFMWMDVCTALYSIVYTVNVPIKFW